MSEPVIYPCGCSKHKVHMGMCDQHPPVLFRPQRGGLVEAMQEVTTVHCRAQLVEHLTTDRPWDIVRIAAVEPYGRDDRIGWDTYIVTGECRDGSTVVIGFTNGQLPD